jgi:hypothetical protein
MCSTSWLITLYHLFKNLALLSSGVSSFSSSFIFTSSCYLTGAGVEAYLTAFNPAFFASTYALKDALSSTFFSLYC